MKSFKIQDPALDVHKGYFLEASAGTGKTYSIENIFVRLLIEEPALELEEILTVTFTRAATRELKERIRKSIKKTLEILKNESGLPEGHFVSNFDELMREKAAKRLEKALFNYDSSQIFTIHGFSSRILSEFPFESDSPAARIDENGEQNGGQAGDIIRDFLFSELTHEVCTPWQLNRVVHAFTPVDHNEGFRKLCQKLETDILKHNPILKKRCLQADMQAFCQARRKIPLCTHENLLADADYYVKNCHKRTESPDFALSLEKFSAIMAKEQWGKDEFIYLLENGIFWCGFAAREPLKCFDKSQLRYPSLLETLNAEILPLLKYWSDPDAIYARIAYHAREFLLEREKYEELFQTDYLLKKFYTALQNPLLVEKVRERYKAAIIDEFQDTDPLQWGIFGKLFLNQGNGAGKGHTLYLVGDPKQSIYSFRQADIYTYMKAAEAMGEDKKASLDTNFRSQPSLVEALNYLFSSSQQPLIQLPRLKTHLPYLHVKPGGTVAEKAFSDQGASVQFFSGDTKSLTLFTANEIKKLHSQDHVNYRQFAILVKSRYESASVADTLRSHGIPCIQQRTEPLASSLACRSLIELIEALIYPRKESAMKLALAGPIIEWPPEKIQELDDPVACEAVLKQFFHLQGFLIRSDFIAFFQELMASCWNGSRTCLEGILSRKEGLEFYQDLAQISELIAARQHQIRIKHDQLPAFLRELGEKEGKEDSGKMRRQDPNADAVQIMTLFTSKGLEFDIVFALGLAKANKTDKEPGLITIPGEGETVRIAPCDATEEELKVDAKDGEAENLRQVYVALTRAKYRLYIPYLQPEKKKKPQNSVNLLLDMLGIKDELGLQLYAEEAQAKGRSIAFRSAQEAADPIQVPEMTISPLTPPPHVSIPGEALIIKSFTSLSTGKKSALPPAERLEPPRCFQNERKDPHTLPSGNETGVLLHTLLENIPFSLAQGSRPVENIKEFIIPHLANTPFSAWDQAIAEMLHRTLTAPLPPGRAFSLSEIPECKQYRETDFLFREKTSGEADYIKGVIDLVFEMEGKIYLLDWKSNWLGPSQEHYTQANIGEAMRQNDYLLQAELYKRALQKYAALTDSRPFEEIFGGIFYLFLRGMPEGIFYLPASKSIIPEAGCDVEG